MSLGWTFIPESGGSPHPLLGRLLTLQHSPVTVSSCYPVIQEPALLTRGDRRGQEADTPHGPFSGWTKIQLKKYFIKLLLLFLISSEEYWLAWQQGCSEVKTERSKADALGCSSWLSRGSPGCCQEWGRPPGKLPWKKRGAPAFPRSAQALSTKWTVLSHLLVAVRREEGKGRHTGISCFACGGELTLLICSINSETSFLWCSGQLLGKQLPLLGGTLLLEIGHLLSWASLRVILE